MSTRNILPEPTADESIDLLHKEIESLKNQLNGINHRIRNIEIQIQCRYSVEISRIRELGSLYKQQKKAKKEKRQEQKRRGKNYIEPKGLKNIPRSSSDNKKAETTNEDLRRLYREAMLKVHPDKFATDTKEMHRRSQELTVQLIDIYQSGDIEQLMSFYNHIMSGNAIASGLCEPDNIPDPVSMKAYLLKEKATLCNSLDKIKNSRLYEVLEAYDTPKKFIDELSGQFQLRIQQLERRTRINKHKP